MGILTGILFEGDLYMAVKKENIRRAGVLLPVSSLPSPYGIGTFGKAAYDWIDYLKASGQSLWQILPLGPTGYGDSPYQSFSTFAGNPYFIDLEKLMEEGLIKRSECNALDWGGSERYVDYEKMFVSRFAMLKKAYQRAVKAGLLKDEAYLSFCRKNKSWLDDYSLYMALKNHFGGKSYLLWDDDIRLREKKALEKYAKLLASDIDFYRFQQFEFSKQWKALKKYANDNGIMIVGDIPIYVAPDGADTWSDPKLFQLDEKGYPIAVAGCPPDQFTADGQLWGNPLYDWDYHKKTGYKWWMKRLKACFDMYDIVRIDHFRGFYSYWSVPYGDKNARGGKWIKGPGLDLFNVMKEKLGDRPVIAEDLGFLTDGVIRMVEKTGYPGMKVLQFGFDPSGNSEHTPHTFRRNFVVYTGTHDNDTILHWSLNCDRKIAKYAMKYTGVKKRSELPDALIRACYASVADTCIIPLQDYLGLDNEARINTPSTLGDNWKWRSTYSDWTVKLSKRMNKLVKLYGRYGAAAPR